jgi:hypothetical protein
MALKQSLQKTINVVWYQKQTDEPIPLRSQRDLGCAQKCAQRAIVARQLNKMFEVSPTAPWTGPGIPPDAYRAAAERESGMAENVRWALERENPNGRLVVFCDQSRRTITERAEGNSQETNKRADGT